MNVKSFCASLLCLAMLVTSASFAQTDVGEADRAVLNFDFQIGKLRDSSLADAINLDEQMSNMQMGGPLDAESMSKLDRIFGSMSAPADMMSVMGLQPGSDLPIDFFVRFQFSDSEAAAAMIEELKDEAEGEEIDGRTYYRPPEGEPQNIVACLVDEKTIEMGTESYVFQSDRDFATDALSSIWDGMPNEAIRIAADLNGASDFINEAVEMGQEGAPPMAKPMLGLVTKAASLRLSADGESDNLFTLIVTGKDEDQAEEIRGGLDGMLGMAKFAGMQQVQALKEEDEEAAKVAKELMDSLTATRDGNDVKVAIPRPEGFEDFIKKMTQMAGGDFRP